MKYLLLSLLLITSFGCERLYVNFSTAGDTRSSSSIYESQKRGVFIDSLRCVMSPDSIPYKLKIKEAWCEYMFKIPSIFFLSTEKLDSNFINVVVVLEESTFNGGVGSSFNLRPDSLARNNFFLDKTNDLMFNLCLKRKFIEHKKYDFDIIPGGMFRGDSTFYDKKFGIMSFYRVSP